MKLKIADRRRKCGLTQEQLALQAGVSPTAINFFENNKKLPSLQVAYNIARALDCKVDDIISA